MSAVAMDEYLDGLLSPSAPAASATPAVALAEAAAPAGLPVGAADVPAPAPASAAVVALAPSPLPFRTAVGDRPARAETVDEEPKAAAIHSTRWLRLRCGAQNYAVELLKVQEVMVPVPLLPMRGAGAAMRGVMNLRGLVVPVVDLGLRLDQGAIVAEACSRIVVLEQNGEALGMMVSAVDNVINLREAQIEPPDHNRVGRISNALFRGIAREPQGPVILLDADALLQSPA